MARRNRSNALELNFDGLADSVTNLVGALILLVVMIIGVSKDAITQAETPPSVQSGKEGSDKPTLPLKQRIALLEAEVSHMDASIGQLHGRLEPLKQEVEELLEKVDSVQPPPKKEEDKPRDRVTKEIPFRPPFEHRDNRRQVSFVVEDGRVSFLDMEEADRQIKSKMGRKSHMLPIKADLESCQFRLDGEASQEKAAIKVLRRAGEEGETLADAEKEGSLFHQKLGQLNPNEASISFTVYPDSFDEFRRLRQIIWERKFDYNWLPMHAGEVILLSWGGGEHGVQ